MYIIKFFRKYGVFFKSFLLVFCLVAICCSIMHEDNEDILIVSGISAFIFALIMHIILSNDNILDFLDFCRHKIKKYCYIFGRVLLVPLKSFVVFYVMQIFDFPNVVTIIITFLVATILGILAMIDFLHKMQK